MTETAEKESVQGEPAEGSLEYWKAQAAYYKKAFVELCLLTGNMADDLEGAVETIREWRHGMCGPSEKKARD